MEEELLGDSFLDAIIAGDADLLGGSGASCGAAGDDRADWCHWVLSPVRASQVNTCRLAALYGRGDTQSWRNCICKQHV